MKVSPIRQNCHLAAGAIFRVAALALAVLAVGVPAARAQSPGNFSTLTTTGTATLGGDVLACSGRPWIDVRCNGAVGDDSHDDTSAIQTTIEQAVAGGYPMHIAAGTYKVSSEIAIDYGTRASTGFQLIAEGATIDGTSIPSGPVLQVECSGGTPSAPKTCFYFRQRGTLFVRGNTGTTNLTTLTQAYNAGATTLSVSATTPFYTGQTVIIALASGGTFAAPVTAIGSGTITIAGGLPSATDVNAQVSAPSYAFALGKTDFSDQHNSFKIDHLVVNNESTSPGAGGCQFNAVYDSDIYAVCDSAGGAAGIALEQVQFSKIAGAGSANGTGGASMALENGYNFSDTLSALDLEASPTCLSITDQHHGYNTWLSPYFNCTTAVNATAGDHNLLINPQYAGNVVNFGPQSTGISVQGTGSRPQWMFPSATYTAAAIDDGLAISSYNAPGASLTVTLPAAATLNAGWSMQFATDNGKGLTVDINGSDAARILAGSKQVSSLVFGPGNYEHATLQFDGNNFRLLDTTRSTRLAMGFDPAPWPTNWLYPSTSGYSATVADNGNVLSSYNTSGGLTVTLPSIDSLPPTSGWTMGFATDNDQPVTVQVNGTDGGQIVYPGSGSSLTSVTMPVTQQGAYEFMVVAYDSAGDTGNFRIVSATPATAQALGMTGSGGISQWLFPSTATYAATVTDGGRVISSANSPSSYLAVTLPSTTGLPEGWTIGVAQDNGKTVAVQVNGSAGGHILFPGSGATTASLSLAPNNYESATLQYDGGGNFRLLSATPATATLAGVTGSAPGITRWNFPSAATYVAGPSDSGNALSSYNTAAGLTVTLPAPSAIQPGWIMGFASDNGKTMTVNTNGGSILIPAQGGLSVSSLPLASGSNYEFAALQFDGSNFRVVSITPQSLNAFGGLLNLWTPADNSACRTGQFTADSNYLYFCTAPSTWKRAAWSSF